MKSTLDSIQELEECAREIEASLDNLHGAIVPVPAGTYDITEGPNFTSNERLEILVASMRRSLGTLNMIRESFYLSAVPEQVPYSTATQVRASKS